MVASCWLFLLSHTTMHGSINIKNIIFTTFCTGVKLGLFLIKVRA